MARTRSKDDPEGTLARKGKPEASRLPPKGKVRLELMSKQRLITAPSKEQWTSLGPCHRKPRVNHPLRPRGELVARPAKGKSMTKAMEDNLV